MAKSDFNWLLRSCKPLWDLVNNWPWLAKRLNAYIINTAVSRVPSRPRPFTTLGPYTSWDSLMDRSWNGRHLPAKQWDWLPPENVVAELFARPKGNMRASPKSTILFPSFAQWFTDAFMRTDPTNPLRNTSPHEICLSQLYGSKPEHTCAIRLGWGGRLKSQLIRGEEYAPYFFADDGLTIRPEFTNLPLPFRIPTPEQVPYAARSGLIAQRRTMFAFAGDRANTTPMTSMMNTLFLREHNRICGVLQTKYPQWNDERLFQTARNITIVMLITIVVEDYINHISPYYFKFLGVPSVVWTAHWNRQNWIAAEFNLLYRWHSLVPDKTTWPGSGVVPSEDMIFDNRFLTDVGLGAAMHACSTQKAGSICLFNTPWFLQHTQLASIRNGRAAQLASYNDYLELMGEQRATTFDQITGDRNVQAALQQVYRKPDNIEFYVGLFAEAPSDADLHPPYSAVPGMIGTLVAVDAFSQALTNPLLAQNVFNANTFSKTGMEIIEQTHTLQDLLNRNVPTGSGPFLATLTQVAP